MNAGASILQKVVKGTRAGAIPGAVIGAVSFPLNYYLLAVRHVDELQLLCEGLILPLCQG